MIFGLNIFKVNLKRIVFFVKMKTENADNDFCSMNHI